MPPSTDPPFKVDHLPVVEKQLEEITQEATQQGFRPALVDSLKAAAKALKDNPSDWGDPKYHTKHKGGTVFQRIIGPLVVDYVVYEHERAVIVLNLMLTSWSKPSE